MQVRSTLLPSEATREPAARNSKQFVDVEGHYHHVWSVRGSDEKMAVVQKLDVSIGMSPNGTSSLPLPSSFIK